MWDGEAPVCLILGLLHLGHAGGGGERAGVCWVWGSGAQKRGLG